MKDCVSLRQNANFKMNTTEDQDRFEKYFPQVMINYIVFDSSKYMNFENWKFK